MCDELTHGDAEREKGFSRREMAVAATAAGLTALLPSPAYALPVSERRVMITTPDGVADCHFVAPTKGKHPAVLVWPDIRGLRPAFEAMGKRLAESGYAVLTVNPFYRKMKAPIMTASEKWDDPAVRQRLFGMMGALTPVTQVTDAKAFSGWLDAQPQVNRRRKMGTTGYCMGGPIVMRTAGALPGRVGAGASFHGASLATDKPDSPHLQIPLMRANLLLAIAENDDARSPNEKVVLRQACDAAKRHAEIEVYKGALHGWCPPDGSAYHAVQAERAWARMLALFKRSL
jgi:carboxymethylenebutenolidase